jgi:(1->4)-alpha-D-glucan 1-alpha-D-glucosylmutase
MNPDPGLAKVATYRIQLRPGFGFDEVVGVLDYLVRLGVSHVYFSPYLQAARGSTHGYDVVDHSRVSQDLGGEEAHGRLVKEISRRGLGQMIDVVPNHMSVADPRNIWWWDILENGPSSRYAFAFDVDWNAPEERLRDRLLLPVLGEHYGRVLDAGAIQVVRTGGDFCIRVYDTHRYPVAPISLAGPLKEAARRSGSRELAFVADALAGLPAPTATDQESRALRHRDKAVIGCQLERLFEEKPDLAAAVDEILAETNADVEALHAFLEGQNFRLTFWKAASHDLGYRRFFDINDLAALRIHDERVFLETHELILRWVAEGSVQGLRIDHVDGLLDPLQYLDRLAQATPGSWIVVEKILEGQEVLPEVWPVAGTTGYDFLEIGDGLFVDPGGVEALQRLYREYATDEDSFASHARECRRLVLRELMAGDLSRLTDLLVRICERRRHLRDHSRDELRALLEEALLRFPVYRTYVRAGKPVSEADRATISSVLADLSETVDGIDPGLVDFLGCLLRGEVVGFDEGRFAHRFQQLSSPVMAKGVEDTAFYRYVPLLSRNEVGGDPGHVSRTVDEFHSWCERIAERWPETLLCTSTHDTKRSADTRLRISLLSEVPDRWRETLEAFSRDDPRRDGEMPDRVDRYIVYQTLVGAWPLSFERLREHLLKVAREAKRSTSWHRPDEQYEQALFSFAEKLVSDPEVTGRLESLLEEIRPALATHSLAHTLLHLTVPGVPDIYQGCELVRTSLTDPDNRRPVDFEKRAMLLAEVEGLDATAVLARGEEGLAKLFLIRKALSVRKRHLSSFGREGTYRRLEVEGEHRDRVVAFTRGEDVATVVPRLVQGLQRGFGSTSVSLPSGRWTCELTGRELDGKVLLAELLAPFPVSLLVRNE